MAAEDGYVEPWNRGRFLPPPTPVEDPGLLDILTPVALVALAVMLALMLFFALRKVAELMAADLYGQLKRSLGGLFRRGRKKPSSGSGLSSKGRSAPSERAPVIPVIQTSAGRIVEMQYLAEGDESRLFSARLESASGGDARAVVVKIPVSDQAAERLREEAEVLQRLRAEARQYAKHLPELVTRFRTADRRLALVFEALDGVTLSQLRERFSDGIEPRHVVWIFRRSLSVLGYAHSQQVLHGNLTPDHLLIRPRDHNLWLLDWTRAIAEPSLRGQEFRMIHPIYGPPEAHRHRPALPSSDLYSLALCMVFALGGRSGQRHPPAATPDPLARLLEFMLKESPVQRPQDAWELYNQLETIRDDLYGPHRFVEFVVD